MNLESNLEKLMGGHSLFRRSALECQISVKLNGIVYVEYVHDVLSHIRYGAFKYLCNLYDVIHCI